MLIVAVVALVVRAVYFIGFTQNPYFNHVHWAHDSIVMHEGALLFTNGDLLLNKQGMKYPFYSYFIWLSVIGSPIMPFPRYGLLNLSWELSPVY